MRYVVALSIAIVTGCAPPEPPKDAVVMKVSDTEAHVRLGKDRVAIGDELVFRRKYCEPDPARGKSAEKCSMRIVGHARVVRFEGSEYAVVQVYKGGFDEGDLVERAP